MSGLHNAIGPHSHHESAQRDGKWSGRKTTLFVVGSCAVCWSLLIGKAALIL